jgi:enamine deaminase RidA (YjgF/YER057c/UK114 family)
MSVYEKLQSLNIMLTPLPPAVGSFVPFVRTANMVYVSGHIAKRDGKPWQGKLGDDISVSEGVQAARSIAADLINTLHAATGDLRRVERIVKLLVLVNSTSAFNEQHLVANGASDLLREVFGDQGAHARSAFGVAQIPLGACVEVELIAEVSAGD